MEQKNAFTQKLKPLRDKLSEQLRRFSPQAMKYIIWSVIAIVSFILGLIVGCEGASGPKRLYVEQNLGTTETIDSFIAVMPEGSAVIARFNDQRHSLYYLKSGHLMRFNAQSKMLEEVKPETSNANLEIYYDDMEEKSGIIAAKLSQDEKFIFFTAVTRRQNSAGEPLQTQNYKLNTESLNLLTYDGKALDPPPTRKDTTRVRRQRSAEEAGAEAAEATMLSPTETTVVPATETSAPAENHAEPKAAEPKPADHHTAAPETKGQETVVVPAP